MLSCTQIATEVRDYYRSRGWHRETGQPFADTTERLGLTDVVAAARTQNLLAERPEPLPVGSPPYATELESAGAPAE